MTELTSALRAGFSERVPKAIERWPQLSLCLLTIIAFIPVKGALVLGQQLPETRIWLFVLLCAVSALFFRVKIDDLPKVAKLTLQGIGVLFALYLAFAYPSLLHETIGDRLYLELTLYRSAGALLFLAGLWRPALMLPAFVAIRFVKLASSNATGLPITTTDYTPVIEFGCLLTLGACIVFVGRRFYGLWQNEPETDRLEPIEAVYLTAVAVHFANYFYSALQKIVIGDPWWQWITQNPTQYLTLAAWERGNLPLTALGDTVTGALYQALAFGVVPLNLAVLALQLAAIVALARIRWIIVLTALYDVTHLVIALVSGIFFYKWIWLNLLIVVSLTLIASKPIPRQIQAWLVAVLLLAPNLFFVARLGWFDTPSFNDEFIEAVTADGKTYRVPDNYFLSFSVTHAQQRLLAEKPGHFITGAYGTLYQNQLPRLSFEEAQDCHLDTTAATSLGQAVTKAGLDDYILGYSQYIASRLDAAGRLNYDLYPHHIFSMPWEHSQFHDLDKRQIVGYRYVVESKCLQFDHGRPHAKVLARGEHYVPLGNKPRQ
jgi:hypothetical protein